MYERLVYRSVNRPLQVGPWENFWGSVKRRPSWSVGEGLGGRRGFSEALPGGGENLFFTTVARLR